MPKPVAHHTLRSLNIIVTQVCKEDQLPLDTDAQASCTSYPKKYEHNCNKCVRRISYHWTLMPQPVACHTPRSLNIIVTSV